MRVASMLFLAVAAACNPTLRSDGGPAVTLRVEPESVAAGDTVTLVLRNGTDEMVGYNLCSSALERRVGDAWQSVPEDRVCTMELRTLDAGGEASYPLGIPAGASAGEYRYVTNVERLESGQRGAVRSEPFRVTS